MLPGTGRAGLCSLIIVILSAVHLIDVGAAAWKRREDKTKCPKVKGIRNFDISEVRSALRSVAVRFDGSTRCSVEAGLIASW